MSRRDTIIVAVLINVGLLIVLFASALKKSPDSEFVLAPTHSGVPSVEVASKSQAQVVAGDEVDVALHQFAQKATPVLEQPLVSAPTPSPFVDDLKVVAEARPIPTPAVQVAPKQIPAVPALYESANADFTEVKVKKGDVLEKIARHHQSTVAEIMKVNGLTNSHLRIGQVLKIPHKAKSPTVALVREPNAAEPRYYLVKKGDSPWSIAAKNHMKLEDLLKLNQMTQDQAHRLKPGDKLRIQ